ncbi:GtrA family protein [Halomonas hibernica]|uniref:GtrA family protein n=1 Tax=Halomonas hibernica TaxID=2591147 RepID=UPI0015549076|nr:GtrA family protein [Halomonas hibernica]
MLTFFSRYLSVGVVNTLLHWTVFIVLHSGVGLSQAWSNILAFSVAVTFSFFANALYTFKARATPKRYVLFTLFMGALSFGVGAAADHLMLPAWVTLVLFSGISLVVGFAYSKWIVFKEQT